MTKEIKKVVVVGPECTGKSTLSEWLANRFNTKWTPEYARGFLENLARPYEQHDLLTIAHGQLRLEDAWAQDADKVLICDTNLYVIKVWSEFKFGSCHQEILDIIAKRHYDLYLLTYIDVPWEDDPQREHPDRRQELYDIYLREMQNQSVPFVEIRGDTKTRQKAAANAVEALLGKVS